jgi:HEAT repeat protein
MRIVFGLKCEDMVAKYIAGHHEMSMTAWLRAVEAWPEIIELLQETDNERALKGRQRALDRAASAEVVGKMPNPAAREPKVRWCKRTSKRVRREREMVREKARQLRAELGMPLSAELGRPI